jgi:hypothetical protein
MRMPRFRFTIGRLMVAVLVPGLTLWVVMFCVQVSRERRAESAYRRSVQVLEIAEMSLREYVEAIYPQEVAVLDGEIALAGSDLVGAIDRLEWSKKMSSRGQVSNEVHLANQLELNRASFALEQVRTKFEVLRKYTVLKQSKEMQSDVAKARVAVKVRREQYEAERSRRRRLIGL